MLSALLLSVSVTVTPPLRATALVDQVKAEGPRVLPALLSTYEWLHMHPEPSNREVETAKRMRQELERLGMEVYEGIGGTGVVGVMRGKKPGPGPVILVRADMDALPITEATGLAYASRNPGVMHACGHDIHMANALGAFAILKAIESQWSGTVLAVMQPAEETGSGALAMVNDPEFQRILARTGKPALVLAIHVTERHAAGEVSMRAGFYSANVDWMKIVVHGKGGHGAAPERTIDPLLIGASIIVELQSIVSRRVKPGELAVISVGKFEGGTKSNIIPQTAEMELTVRSYGDEMRAFLLEEIKRVAVNVARAHGAPQDPEVVVGGGFVPSTHNDPTWNGRLRQVFIAALGDAGKVHVEDRKSGGGEDFGQFPRTLGIPGVIYNLGVQPQALIDKLGEQGVPSVHSDTFAPDARTTLAAGTQLMALAILEGLLSAPLAP